MFFDQSARSRNSSILFTYMAEPHGENTKANFCFALVCKLVVEFQKEYFSFHLCGLATWSEHERESLVWFSSQRVCGGPTKFYSLHLHGCVTCTKS